MRIVWSDYALADIDRLHRFLADVSPRAASDVVEALVSAPDRLLLHPRLGVRHESMDPDEVRRLFIGKYEMRYQLLGDEIAILRIFHAKEERS